LKKCKRDKQNLACLAHLAHLAPNPQPQPPITAGSHLLHPYPAPRPPIRPRVQRCQYRAIRLLSCCSCLPVLTCERASVPVPAAQPHRKNLTANASHNKSNDDNS
jgi:hypothetical protein